LAQIVITTHQCAESHVKKALAKLGTLEEVNEIKGIVRIEE
jgi:hypothetical protein